MGREKTQITKIRNEREDITTNLTEIKKIIKKYCEQLYINKLDNLDKMDRFLERHKLPNLTREKIKYQNRPKTSKEIELIILKLLTKKRPGINDFTGEIFKELISIFHKLLQKITEWGTLSTLNMNLV